MQPFACFPNEFGFWNELPSIETCMTDETLDALARAADQSLNPGMASPTNLQIKGWRSNGFSDSAIYRLHCNEKSYAIRSWPDRVDTLSKIQFWRAIESRFLAEPQTSLTLLGAVASNPFPRLYAWDRSLNVDETVLGIHPASRVWLHRFGERLWTLSEWVPGTSIPSGPVPPNLIVQLARILARLHAQTSVATDEVKSPLGQLKMPSRAIEERWLALKAIDHRLFAAVDRSPFLAAVGLSDRVKHVLGTVLHASVQWKHMLSVCAGQTRTCHWIVRDLWRENVLVDEAGDFSSIVDLGAARVDWPGLDFTRLFGSLLYPDKSFSHASDDPSDSIWRLAYEAYSAEYPDHSIESLEECRMLHEVSSGLAIAQWVTWIDHGTFESANTDKFSRIADRISELCDQFLALYP